MRVVFISARYEGNISLSKEAIDYIISKNIKTIGLFASVQFLKLDDVKRALTEKGIKIVTSSARRTEEEVQVLGCDAYHDSYDNDILTKVDATLYIGDGEFHPKAIALALVNSKQDKECIIFNPIENKLTVLTSQAVKKQNNRRKANIMKYLSAQVIGILVSTKTGQEYLKGAIALKEKLKKEDKKAYIFIDDTIALDKLENYPFIKAWVNTACPRIGTDDITSVNSPLVNLKDANDPIDALSRL